jgi:cyanophycinase
MRGPLVLIGGGERTDGDATILRRVVRLAGGRAARIAVCTVASAEPRESYHTYHRTFTALGAGGIEAVHVSSRAEARRLSALRTVATATALFFTGGDQLRLTSLLGGTPLETALKRAFVRGMCVAGTSAGASAVSATMIVGGESTEAPKMNTIRMAPGLGLLGGVVVDQHFAQRGRIGRLLSALAQNPRSLGLGLDEDTAVEIRPDGMLTVIGSQTVTILDPAAASFTNASESAPDQPLALAGVRLCVLPAGFSFRPGAGAGRGRCIPPGSAAAGHGRARGRRVPAADAGLTRRSARKGYVVWKSEK